MPESICKYGPPDSDSDDSNYDGFYFGDEIVKKDKYFKPYVAPEQKLYDAVLEGDINTLREQINLLSWNVDNIVRGGYSLLLIACFEGHYNIVEYLIVEKQANVNRQVDSVTPLMKACDCYKKVDGVEYIVEKMVKLLLAHGAVINVSDKFGVTPFMLACKHGYVAVVRMLIKDVSFDAVDNMGSTPIFYAVENNCAEIVKLLVEAGVNTSIANRKGYTPSQVAEFHGFNDLLQFFPRREVNGYVVPSKFLGYNNLRDHIPRIFLKSECPEYFQEINNILNPINMQNFLEYFAKERVSLAEFLIMNDEKLERIGIKYPIYRMKIMRGILDFHLHHWSKHSIARVSMNSKENFYEILLLTANQLQHLVIIQASLRFVAQNQQAGHLGNCSHLPLTNFRQCLMSYRNVIDELYKTTKYLGSFSPERNPLYINYDDILAERQSDKVRRFFKYTSIVLGISVFVCLKVKNVF